MQSFAINVRLQFQQNSGVVFLWNLYSFIDFCCKPTICKHEEKHIDCISPCPYAALISCSWLPHESCTDGLLQQKAAVLHWILYEF